MKRTKALILGIVMLLTFVQPIGLNNSIYNKTNIVKADTINTNTASTNSDDSKKYAMVISSENKYETAATVAASFWNWGTTNNVILVSGESYADAISASSLSKSLNAPILLTPPSELDSNVPDTLTKLGAKNIFIVGGTGAISQSVRDQLKSNYKLIELYGNDRYATNLAVANYLIQSGTNPDNVMMVTGENFPDALSIAPIAATKNEILLLSSNDLTKMQPTINFIAANKSKVTVVGTTNTVNDTIYNAVNAVSRISGGTDRFDTNLKVLQAFKSDINFNNIFVANATGSNSYSDALVASAAASQTGAALVLFDTESSTATSNAIAYINTNRSNSSNIDVVREDNTISDETVKNLNGYIPTVTNADGGKPAAQGVVGTAAGYIPNASSYLVNMDRYGNPIGVYDSKMTATTIAQKYTFGTGGTSATFSQSTIDSINNGTDRTDVYVTSDKAGLNKVDISIIATKYVDTSYGNMVNYLINDDQKANLHRNHTYYIHIKGDHIVFCFTTL